MVGNRLTARVRTSEHAGPSGSSAFDLQGEATISNTRISGNSVSAEAVAGPIAAVGTIYVCGAGCSSQSTPPRARIIDTSISDNSVTAHGPDEASVYGAGIASDALLDLRNVRITDNHGSASGLSGVAQGGGIRNAKLFFDFGPVMTMTGSTVTGNSLTAAPGIVEGGAGLYTDAPVAMHGSKITENTPDQCFGCS